MTEKLEIELVEAAVDGDIASFGELAKRYYAAMVAVGYSVLTDHSLAEDAAQESLARAMVKLCGLKNKTKFAPWLAAICRNVAKDMVTARRKQVCSENIWQAVEDKAGGDEQAETVRNAIEKLAAAERELVVLRYYNSLSYEQISAVLGISKPAINGRLKRAKRKLAKFLRDSGLPEERL